jgi:hypothetical protein
VSKSDVVGSLTENVVINCGAMTLWNDLKAVPIKGQLAMLAVPTQPGEFLSQVAQHFQVLTTRRLAQQRFLTCMLKYER